ncbi:hypothetical protein COHA_008158 [Chlorella ohadii]|uniref:Uncharacterized protein n=1 Tax=Chlorella ohadii TaxID=2649997 RepID=A0AAD5DHE3_9CHLO|nr:hypothetical protein COHA_008158 [Chlorella ohadii]
MRAAFLRSLPLLLAAVVLLAGTAAAQPCTVDVEDPNITGDFEGASGCAQCAPGNATCKECWDRFGLSSEGTCVPCNVTSDFGSFAVKCDGDDPSIALECISECRKGWCTGLYATAEGTCGNCPDENAAHCTTLNGTTIDCNPRSTLIDGVCLSCAEENCDDCTGDVTVCKTCTKGYTKIKRWCVEEKA